MRILVINANTTEAMTEDVAEEARRYAHPDTELVCVSAPWGPVSIESHYEMHVAGLAVCEAVQRYAGDVDGVVVGCYGDPGLYAAREISPVPVVGIAEASMLMACTVAHRFSIVTVLPRVIPFIENMARVYGVDSRVASVRGTPLTVLACEADPDAARREIVVAAKAAIAEDGAEAICLGCAGMGPLDKAVQEEVGVPVLDGVACAVKLVEGLVGYGVASSRVAAFKHPEPKHFVDYEPGNALFADA